MNCALCPRTYNCVSPSGPSDADIVCIGEAPGFEENKRREPFVGRTGREVDGHYLPLAGLRRSNIRFDNAIRCLPDTPSHKLDLNDHRHQALLDSCSSTHLLPYLLRARPRLLIPMGAFACHAIDPDIQLDLHHGFPIETKYGMAFPMWHPAGGLHEPKKMLQIRTDWVRLRKYLAGKLLITQDEYPEPDYQECNDYTDVTLDPTLPMACDTEYSKSLGPYCLTYSQECGTGRLIPAHRPDLLTHFQRQIEEWESIIIFHHWLYDYKVVTEMKLRFPDQKIRDSMLTAFHLGNIPQGLKALCFRELGMLMEDFDDLVTPHSKDVVLDYLREMYLADWPKPEPEQRRNDDGSYRTYRPQSVKTKIKRFYTDLSKNENMDVFKRWDNWEDHHQLIETVMGKRWPGKDIAHVPFEKALTYACRDADATLRLWPVLMHMARNMRRQPQENWRD